MTLNRMTSEAQTNLNCKFGWAAVKTEDQEGQV